MVARLAFSVAVSVDPEILIVDEALSTGDMIFAAKSYARMREIAKSGATVLLVTHSMQQIYEMCDKAILLENGLVSNIGTPREVGYIYEQKVHEEVAAMNSAAPPTLHIQSMEDQAHVPGPRILFGKSFGVDGNETSIFESGQKLKLSIFVTSDEDVGGLSVGYILKTITGVAVYGDSTSLRNVTVRLRKNEISRFDFEVPCDIAEGSYFVMLGLSSEFGELNAAKYYNAVHVVGDGVVINVVGGKNFIGQADLKGKFLGIHAGATATANINLV